MANAPAGAGGDIGFIDAVSEAGTVTADTFGGFASSSGAGPDQALADAIQAAVQSRTPQEALTNPTVVAQLEADGVNVASFIESLIGETVGGGRGRNPMMDPTSKEAAIMRTGSRAGLVDLARTGLFGKEAQDQVLNAGKEAEQFSKSFFANVLGLSKQTGMTKSGTFTNDIFANIDPLGILTGIIAGPVAGYLAGKASPLDLQVNLTGRTTDVGVGGKTGDNAQGSTESPSFADAIDSGVTVQENDVRREREAIAGTEKTEEEKPRNKGAYSDLFERGMAKFFKMPQFEILNGVTDFIGGLDLGSPVSEIRTGAKFADERNLKKRA